MHLLLNKCGRLAGATVVIALILLWPAWGMYGALGASAVALSGLICLVAGWVCLCVCEWSAAQGRDVQGILAGIGVRMALVLGAALAVCLQSPALRESGFLWWLTAFYLAALVVETRLLLGGGGDRPRAAVLGGRQIHPGGNR